MKEAREYREIKRAWTVLERFFLVLILLDFSYLCCKNGNYFVTMIVHSFKITLYGFCFWFLLVRTMLAWLRILSRASKVGWRYAALNIPRKFDRTILSIWAFASYLHPPAGWSLGISWQFDRFCWTAVGRGITMASEGSGPLSPRSKTL